MPTKRTHRPQKAEQVELEDTRQVSVSPPLDPDDRMHNPKDLEIDRAAIDNGIEHGGTVESHAETRAVRGSGGRKRSGPAGSHRSGRDLSKRR